MKKEIEIQAPNGITTINQDGLFIIAEVGNQFNGNVDTAKELCKVAKRAGADAVKFIFWFPDEIMADKNQTYSYDVWCPYPGKFKGEDLAQVEHKTEPMFDLLNKLRLANHEWQEVKTLCDKLDIIMMTTVNCPSAFDLAMGLGLPALKLSTWDYNFTDLWELCARTMLPCIADLGAVTAEELTRNVNIFNAEKNRELALLHCFHTDNHNEFNMRSIPYIADKFDCLVGYSSADYNDETDIMAVTLGACILEKRLTLDRMGGVLHDVVSKQPDEFAQYIKLMHKVKSAMGKYDLIPSKGDLEQRKKWFRRIVADTGITKGEMITRYMLEGKRGETGISPERIWDFVGKQARRDIKRNEDITDDCV